VNGSLVVIGASFGGFDALKVVLGALPGNFPLPIAIVQHQGSTGAGLAGLLQRYTALLVVDAEDKNAIDPGRAYLAPPGYHLLVDDDGFALSVDPPVWHARPSIDVLYETAADLYGAGVVGVIQTSTGGDGAGGLARIKAHGGLAIVQDPATAARAAMPAAALARTAINWILPLEHIGPRLLALAQKPAAAPRMIQPGSMDAPRPTPSETSGMRR
jgi:two-component system chemotaxis response regulator CheB